MPLAYLSAYAAGLELHVEDLADYLAARERREDFKARWDELHPAYPSPGEEPQLAERAANRDSSPAPAFGNVA